MAHVKAAGATKNWRNSNPKYRGVKLFGWQTTVAGNIIIRQAGKKYEAGNNTYLWKDFTIHAQVDGIVSFSKKRFLRFDGKTFQKTQVHVIPSN